LIIRNQPDVVVIDDVDAKGSQRVPRIKGLHRNVVALAKQHKIKMRKIAGTELRTALLGNPKGTRHEMAEMLARQFSDELALRLPSKRKLYHSEDARMDIFMAVGLSVVQLKKGF
jgi:Holliday junction resolvasome RuvABC endonuclease subunit